MEKVHCNIIRDLLPSYLDGVTSEESNQMIDKHFEECSECKKAYDLIKKYDFVSEKTDGRIAAYFKKMGQKKKLEQRGLMVLFLLLFVLQFRFNLRGYAFFSSLYLTNCIFYPIYIILLFHISDGWKQCSVSLKKEGIIFFAEGSSFLYIVVLFCSFFSQSVGGDMLFLGMAAERAGGFIEKQIIVLVGAYLLVLFIYFLVQRMGKGYNLTAVMLLLAGVTVLLNMRAGLYQVDGAGSFLAVMETVGGYLVLVIAESIALGMFYRSFMKQYPA